MATNTQPITQSAQAVQPSVVNAKPIAAKTKNTKKPSRVLFYLTQKTLSLIIVEDTKHTTFGSIQFAPTAMLDGEIIDIHELIKQLNVFFTQYHIVDMHYAILIGSDYLYRKDIKTTSVSKMEKEAQDFIDAIPHEYVLSRAFNLKTTTVLATNKDVIRAIEDELKKLECIKDVVAGIELAEDLKKLISSGFNQDSAVKLYQRYASLRSWSMVEADEAGGIWSADLGGSDDEDGVKTSSSLIKSKSNVALYGGVFFILLLILGGVFFFTQQPASQTAQTQQKTISFSSASVQSSQSEAPAQEDTRSILRITIASTQNNAITSKLFIDTLTDAGYTNIVPSTVTVAPKSTTITVNSNLSQDIIDVFKQDIEKIATTSSFKSSSTLTSDITIEVGGNK